MNKVELNTINLTNNSKYMYMCKDLDTASTNTTYSNSKLFLNYLKLKYEMRKIFKEMTLLK